VDNMPMPVDPGARLALEWIPFDWRFNNQILTSKTLKPGNYEVHMDGLPVAIYRAEDLANGVNLATAPTPQRLQAEKVVALNEKRRALMSTLRDVIRFEDVVPNYADPAAREEWLQKLKARSESQFAYYNGLAQRYVKMKPLEAETRQEIDRLSEEIAKANQPAKHEYQFIPKADHP
jgi:hypothetical protein